ncbi:MAG: methyltransferase domain-containing protein [bacterium]|nr:methyltransferase domain-containing protein [bacterium]
MIPPERIFHRLSYLRSTLRCVEHLARLDLPIAGRSVLEVGAGIGNFTSFFLDRGCTVTSTEPRAENVACFRERLAEEPLWPSDRLRIVESDAASLVTHGVGVHDVVVCLQVLNLTGDPESLLETIGALCGELLLVECGTHSGENRNRDTIEFRSLDSVDPGGSLDGRACIPSRPWVFNRLKQAFPHVYMPLEQPLYDRYREDWREADLERGQHRAIFIATRSPLEHPLLVERIPERYPPHPNR